MKNNFKMMKIKAKLIRLKKIYCIFISIVVKSNKAQIRFPSLYLIKINMQSNSKYLRLAIIVIIMIIIIF